MLSQKIVLGLLGGLAVLFVLTVACTPVPIPTLIAPAKPTLPASVKTVQPVAPAVPSIAPTARPVDTRTPRATAEPVEREPRTGVLTPSPTPTQAPPVSFWQQRVTNLYDLSRLPVMDGAITTQYTSRNWVALEHYFDYFVDDGNFEGPHYGYIDEHGALQHYRIVRGYNGALEYEFLPRVEGPGSVDRIWLAYQQHQGINNPKDMSEVEEWSNWGNLGEMGDVHIYFDDETTPRINFTVKNLFVGVSPFLAPLSAFYASADGGNINYVPIPFQRSIRMTSTGRPRLMQIQVKRFVAPSGAISTAGTGPSTAASDGSQTALSARELFAANPLQSFSPLLSPRERAALEEAAVRWQSCTALQTQEYRAYPLSILHNNSAEVNFPTPATIEGLRVRIPRGMEDSVSMQVFWDGETAPSMTAPLRGMFGTAERLLTYRALPMGILSTDMELVFYNNIPMPFQSARFLFTNERAETLPLTLEVAVRDTVPGTESARLHAYYGTRRMQQREDDGDNYMAIDVKGSGKYLGLIFSAWDLDRRALNGPLNEKWRFPYLESNMDVWVDDRLALPGTGIEDDFNASYYYVYAGYEGYNSKYCLAGLNLLDYDTIKEPSSQYRFYLNDAPEFRTHLQVQAQHGNKGNNLSVTYSSTVFWYQLR